MFSRSKEGGWSSDTKCGGKRSGGFIDVNGGVSKGGSLIVTHHEYPSNGYQGGNSGSYGGINTKGGSYSSPEQHIQQVCASLGGNVLGGAYHDGRKNRDKFGDGINYQVKGIISETKYYGFKNPKVIVLSDCALEDRDIAVLTNHLKCHRLDLVVFDVSNNKIGIVGVKYLFGGLRFDNPSAERCIVTMNFSNNLIGDDGAKYMADCLKMGRYPHLKHLDISGNNISYEGNTKFAKGLQNMNQNIKILINKILPINSITSGTKKQSDLLFGSKEEKHAIIKDYLKHAQSDGVYTQNVVVSKGIFAALANNIKLTFNFSIGFTKCNLVPEDFTSFAADKIIAKASKKANVTTTVIDAVACYFEVFDESASSQEGVQFMLDAGFITTSDLLGNVE